MARPGMARPARFFFLPSKGYLALPARFLGRVELLKFWPEKSWPILARPDFGPAHCWPCPARPGLPDCQLYDLYCNTPRCIMTKNGARLLCRNTAGGHAHDTVLGRLRHGQELTRLCAPRCAGWVSRLCTWCTQPIFGLSTVFESLIRHCS